MKKLPVLPFEHFLTFDEMSDFIRRLAAARPDLVTLAELGRSREGRALPMLTITDSATGHPEDKPAYLIHGNIHASELSGTHAALFSAQRLLDDHPGTGLLQRVVFHIIPRLNPDGAEFVVTTSGSIRSRTDCSKLEPNALYQQDVNGDGLILTMRQEHPDGAFAVDPEDQRLLIQRTKDTSPPFYRTFPEGMIHEWDGTDNISMGGRGFDWNRNWSYDWRPEPEQSGAGDFPFSEPEMRALAEFIHSRPNIFAILGYHNGAAAVLRPPSTGADDDLDEADVRTMQQLAEIGAEKTGFPVFPVIKYHRHSQRDNNLRGHFHNFGYHHLGLFVFEFELGLLYNSAGISTEEIFNVKNQQGHEALVRRLMRWWDSQEERDMIFKPWQPFVHPQLGRVEIGGLLRRHLGGPSLADLEKISEGTYRFTVEHAAYHPWVKIEDVAVKCVGSDVFRVRARVANRGQYPTHVSNQGRNLRRIPRVRVEIDLSEGVELLSQRGHVHGEHLPGLTGSMPLEWFLKAPGEPQRLGEIKVHGGTGGNDGVELIPDGSSNPDMS